MEPTTILNKGIRVDREGDHRYAVWTRKTYRWGHFRTKRDAEQFAGDVRCGRAFFSDVAHRMVTRRTSPTLTH